jgi:hypothetical protein
LRLRLTLALRLLLPLRLRPHGIAILARPASETP